MMKRYWPEIIFFGFIIVVVGWAVRHVVFVPGPWPKWTGFKGKTLWDLLELLVVPLILAITAFFFRRSERIADRNATEAQLESDRRISQDRTSEKALQSYLDQMTDLLCNQDLASPNRTTQVKAIARTRTLTILDQINYLHKRIVFRFLLEAGMITSTNSIVPLNDANLSRLILSRINAHACNLRGAYLRGAIFTNVDIEKSKMKGADLTNATLVLVGMRGVELEGANLIGATLNSVDLRDANLKGAVFRGMNPEAKSWEELDTLPKVEANLMLVNLKGATYDTNTVWPEGFDPQGKGAILEA